jgi:hypothetical protein
VRTTPPLLAAEFVNLVASQSNEVATKEKKNTIQPEHVLRCPWGPRPVLCSHGSGVDSRRESWIPRVLPRCCPCV